MIETIRKHIDSITFNEKLKMYNNLKSELMKGVLNIDDHNEVLAYLHHEIKYNFCSFLLKARLDEKISDNELHLFILNTLNYIK
jgi:hypothetical protein